MATKKRKRTTASPKRRRRSTMSAGPKRRRVVRRRKKGFLSELSAQVTSAGRSMGSGAIGGAAYLMYEQKIDMTTWTPEKKGLIALLGSYIATSHFGKPNLGAGIMGAAMYDYAKVTGLLGDDADQVSRMKWADPLQNVPVMLSDEQMALAANGQTIQLQDASGQYMPAYAQTNNY